MSSPGWPSLYEEAVRLDATKDEPQAETLLPGAPRLLLLMGRLKDSDRWLQQALKLSPKSRDAHFELARVLLKKGDATQSGAEGEAALSLSDGAITDAAIHYLLVRAWQDAGNLEHATMHAEIVRAQENSRH